MYFLIFKGEDGQQEADRVGVRFLGACVHAEKSSAGELRGLIKEHMLYRAAEATQGVSGLCCF